MRYTQTIDASVSIVVDELADELTQAELERLIKLARDVKSKKLGCVIIGTDAVRTGALHIAGYKRAA